MGAVPETIGRLLEVVHGSVDVRFGPRAVDGMAIDRTVETAAEGGDACLQAAQKAFHLLVGGARGSLLWCGRGADTRECQGNGESND